jgi:hypothetical protein
MSAAQIAVAAPIIATQAIAVGESTRRKLSRQKR